MNKIAFVCLIYLFITACGGGGGGGGTSSSTPPTLNQAPVANAGSDITVVDSDNNGQETVTLNGSASFDSDGSISSYAWSEGQTSLGTTATVTNGFSVGTHTVTLLVRDAQGATSTDIVIVTVNANDAPPNQAPTAMAGSNQSFIDNDGNGQETVTLDGSASFDPDGSIVSYAWSEDQANLGNTATLTTALAVGVHNINLIVQDNMGASASDSIVITVEAAGLPDQFGVVATDPLPGTQINTNEAITIQFNATVDSNTVRYNNSDATLDSVKVINTANGRRISIQVTPQGDILQIIGTDGWGGNANYRVELSTELSSTNTVNNVLLDAYSLNFSTGKRIVDRSNFYLRLCNPSHADTELYEVEYSTASGSVVATNTYANDAFVPTDSLELPCKSYAGPGSLNIEGYTMLIPNAETFLNVGQDYSQRAKLKVYSGRTVLLAPDETHSEPWWGVADELWSGFGGATSFTVGN